MTTAKQFTAEEWEESHGDGEFDLSANPWEPPQLKAAALHGPLGDLVKRISPHTEAHTAALLLHALTIAGNMMGRKRIKTGAGVSFPNIYSTFISPTGRRKAEALKSLEFSLSQIDPGWWQCQILSGAETRSTFSHP